MLVLLAGAWAVSAATLEDGFRTPPPEALTRVWWWWLNGNVDKAVITRDLEAMHAKGIGGVNIIDAGGAGQRTTVTVPPGPVFGSPAWRELFRHALAEAERCKIEVGLNIQSGWNLGGPDVTPDEAAKLFVWSECTVQGGAPVARDLERPAKLTGGYYRDAFVLAWPARVGAEPAALRASSTQEGSDAARAVDGSSETYWVSAEGFAGGQTQWLEQAWAEPVTVRGTTVAPRPQYGPRACEVQSRQDGGAWQRVAAFELENGAPRTVTFPPVTARAFRLALRSGFDPREPAQPRNVQVAEWSLDGAGIAGARRAPIRDLVDKTSAREMGGSCPRTAHLLADVPEVAGEQDAQPGDVVDLTGKMRGDRLGWTPPAGVARWVVLRFGYTVAPHARVSTCSPTWEGLCVDYLAEAPLRAYWQRNVAPLLADGAGRLGKTWKYIHTDSWELGGVNWTPELPAEFKARRGYDLRPWVPVLAGRIVGSRALSNRFLNDFRRTIGDCIADRHYGVMAQLAAAHGLGIHPESGGPHGAPVDGLQCMGRSALPMMEFWAKSATHRVKEEDRMFVKQGSSAAHTYGLRVNQAEGFTTIGPHWEETLWDNLKPAFDQALCEGLNRLMWHAFTCTPASAGLPGQQYFAGTHLDPNVTWWPISGPFFDYLNRGQFLMQQGLAVADVLFYYGDWVPNFVRLKKDDPARALPEFDYDVCNEEVLLQRVAAQDGRLVLPDGMTYRVLVLPAAPCLSLPALRKVAALVRGGATVIGERPLRTTGLEGFPDCDAELGRLAVELWGPADTRATNGVRRVGAGRVVWGRTARDVLRSDGVAADVEVRPEPADARFEWVHRTAGDREIFFVSNQDGRAVRAEVRCRVSGRAASLWDPVTGAIQPIEGREAGGRTAVTLPFQPYGSWFVVFRTGAQAGEGQRAVLARHGAALRPAGSVAGPWQVTFDPAWQSPSEVTFAGLDDWSKRAEPDIRYYSGIAVYRRTFDLPAGAAGGGALYLDLGVVHNLAEVRLNGRDLGVLWCPPWRVAITDAVQPAGNALEIRVANFWPNRLIGDAALPPEKRRTRTNVTKFKPDLPLNPSGLLGPVQLLRE